MDPRLRTALVVIAAVLLSVFLGWKIADAEYALPALAGAIIVGSLLVYFTGMPVDVILVGFLLVGYLLGNRGFAQLAPVSGVPLLPAEIVLLVAVSWRIVVCGFERRLPFRADALNWSVLAWLILGTVHVGFDVPRYGIFALRDFATVYYATFFFLVQHMARRPEARRFLANILLLSLLALPLFYVLTQLFPAFFLTTLVQGNTPLIYFKGDIAFTFMAIGALLAFHWASPRQRVWAWPFSAAVFVYVVSGENRAAALGSLLTLPLLLLAGRWRFVAFQGAVMSLALLGVLALATMTSNEWADRKVDGLKDRLMSVTDVSGSGRYQSAEAYYKGDNNRFRFVWWRNVITETWETNPLFGLGFGADLARGFVQEYYPETGDEFNTRSPHNIVVTVFGRLGLAGVAVWLLFCGALLQQTWRALRHSADKVVWSLWTSLWIVLVSACLGVVLEGPMGAVIFWSLLGLASSYPTNPPEGEPAAPEKENVEPAGAKAPA